MQLRVGSLFSGIGGIDLGLERAGMRVVWQVENNQYAQAVLRKHWPSASLHGDVREVGSANLEPVDLICGGFPCQDVSLAGKGGGVEKGERSGLWREYARIVCELRPRYVLVENVSALKSRGLDRVLGDLAALGYDAEWDCIPASAIGAPHRRDRIFIVAHAAGQPKSEPGHETQAERDQWDARMEPCWGGSRQQQPGAGANVADTQREGQLQPEGTVSGERGWVGNGCAANDATDPDSTGREQQRGSVSVFTQQPAVERSSWWGTEPDVGRVANGVPSRVDRLRCLGNAVVPQVAEWIGRRILACQG